MKHPSTTIDWIPQRGRRKETERPRNGGWWEREREGGRKPTHTPDARRNAETGPLPRAVNSLTIAVPLGSSMVSLFSPRQRATPGLTLSLLFRYSAVAQAMQIGVRPQGDMVTHGSPLRIASHHGTLCVEAIGFPHRTKPNWAFDNWPEPGKHGALATSSHR